jgi:hypothetical protein
MSAVNANGGTSAAPTNPTPSLSAQKQSNFGSRYKPVDTSKKHIRANSAHAGAVPVAGAAGVTLLSHVAGPTSGSGSLNSRIILASALYKESDLRYFIYKRYQESRPGKTCTRMQKLLSEAHGFEGLDINKLRESFKESVNAGYGFSADIVTAAQQEHAEAKKKSAAASGSAAGTLGLVPPPSSIKRTPVAVADKFTAAMKAAKSSQKLFTKLNAISDAPVASPAFTNLGASTGGSQFTASTVAGVKPSDDQVAKEAEMTMFSKPLPKPVVSSSVALQASPNPHQPSKAESGLPGPNPFGGFYRTHRICPMSEWTVRRNADTATAAVGTSTPQVPQKPVQQAATTDKPSEKEKEAAKPVKAAPAIPAAGPAGP